jgi:multidrug transporter EmrE-like cation transporter
VTLLVSPVVAAICRRKSIRLIATLGGLVTALGCLFTSFATQFHQLFVSYGVIVAIGVSMIRDTAVILIGQYFKRREFVEIFVIGTSGLGIALMPLFLSYCIR